MSVLSLGALCQNSVIPIVGTKQVHSAQLQTKETLPSLQQHRLCSDRTENLACVCVCACMQVCVSAAAAEVREELSEDVPEDVRKTLSFTESHLVPEPGPFSPEQAGVLEIFFTHTKILSFTLY